ncbi:hypothetical protein MRX96_007032 [Rhipicephalus microplus]
MPLNCCVSLRFTNASKDPQMLYHEFTGNVERSAALLRNISCEGPGGKGTVRKLNDRSLVCASRVMEQDYNETEKLKALLPTAMSTAFPGFPSYMSTRSIPDPRKKRCRSELQEDHAQSRAECSDNTASQDRPVIIKNSSSSDSSEATTLNNSELGNETSGQMWVMSQSAALAIFEVYGA